MSSNLDHWNDPNVESMYDKHLLNMEIESIKYELQSGMEILDVGCGEGEGTVEYAKIVDKVHAVDFSNTRLAKAMERVGSAGLSNVQFDNVDMLDDSLTACGCSPKVIFRLRRYDAIICQRFLINLPSWEAQQKVISELILKLKPGGKLILLEGSLNGADQLNTARIMLGMEPIPVKWHNVFIDDRKLTSFLRDCGMKFRMGTGFGTYFMATRLFAPLVDPNHKWDSVFNERVGQLGFEQFMRLGFCSRLKLWVFVR